MFRDFELALSQKLTSLRSKSDSNLNQAEDSYTMLVKPLPQLPQPPPKPKRVSNPIRTTGIETPSLAELCSEVFNPKTKSSNFSQG